MQWGNSCSSREPLNIVQLSLDVLEQGITRVNHKTFRHSQWSNAMYEPNCYVNKYRSFLAGCISYRNCLFVLTNESGKVEANASFPRGFAGEALGKEVAGLSWLWCRESCLGIRGSAWATLFTCVTQSHRVTTLPTFTPQNTGCWKKRAQTFVAAKVLLHRKF